MCVSCKIFKNPGSVFLVGSGHFLGYTYAEPLKVFPETFYGRWQQLCHSYLTTNSLTWSPPSRISCEYSRWHVERWLIGTCCSLTEVGILAAPWVRHSGLHAFRDTASEAGWCVFKATHIIELTKAHAGASIPMGQGGRVPPQYLEWGGHYYECPPQYFRVISVTFHPCNMFLIDFLVFKSI